MSLIIPNYLEPGAYSITTINPTTTTAAGVPVVAIVGQALQGTYEPTLFYNADDAQSMYGVATKANPLPLGISLAFQNGAPQVLGLNVQPSNSTVAYLAAPQSGLPGLVLTTTSLVTSNFPGNEFFQPAPQTLLDPITQQPVNADGATAGVFYIQDFDPDVADPVLNSSPQATALAFATSSGNLLQYIKYTNAPLVNGVQQVPLQNDAMVRVLIPSVLASAVQTATPALSGVCGPQPTQYQYTQFQNAMAIANALNSTPDSPVTATFLVPDFSQTAASGASVPNWREMYSAQGQPILPTSTSSTTVTISTQADLYAYAMNHGVLRIAASQPGSQHEIVAGLFAASTFDDATGTLPFGLTVSVFAGVDNTNPCIFFNNGTDGVVTSQSYIDAINNQLVTVRADIVVVLNTDSTLQSVIQEHCSFMSSEDERNERIAIVSGPISELYTTTIQNVQNIQTGSNPERMVYIWPTGGYYQDAVLRTTVILDGTYLAAACAGILASNDAATPLTRKTITGFTDITIKTTRTAMNSIAQYGVCIIENSAQAGIRVRDGITCNPTSPETQEISVVRQLDYCAQSVRDVLDLNVVATKITTNTLAVVQTLTTTTLQALVTANLLYGFQQVSARIDPNDPRQIDVRFTVRPAYPCKYVIITITVTSSLTGF